MSCYYPKVIQKRIKREEERRRVKGAFWTEINSVGGASTSKAGFLCLVSFLEVAL